MENVLISACLYGEKCRYDGKDNLIKDLEKLKEICRLVPVCPECDGGLSTPRNPSEILDGRVFMNSGKDVTAEYEKGAMMALETARKNGCKFALMKAKSPSCGNGKIYDGTFSHSLTYGDGVAVKLLKKNGVRVFDETQTAELISLLSLEEK